MFKFSRKCIVGEILKTSDLDEIGDYELEDFVIRENPLLIFLCLKIKQAEKTTMQEVKPYVR